MQPKSLLRHSHFLFKPCAIVQAVQPFPQRSSRSLRKTRHPVISGFTTQTRPLSSNALPSPDSSEPSKSSNSFSVETEASDNVDEIEKVTKIRRTRVNSSSSVTKDQDTIELSSGIEGILYLPTEIGSRELSKISPPHEIFDEALDNLLITFHPQNQHRALLPTSGSSRPIEPTLGLYCPIEGGDYIIDFTIHELAYQLGAEVLILDGVHLAAGEWGPFGKAASALNFPNNPLHFTSPSSPGRQPNAADDEGDDESQPFMASSPTRMSIAIPRLLSSTQGRPIVTSSARKASSPTMLDAFFEALINLPCPVPTEGKSQSALDINNNCRPRIIYIRDFPTLAPSSSLWYPSLLSAVRQRRRKMFSRTSSFASSAVTIVFGMTPSISPSSTEGSSGSTSSLMNLIMNRNSSTSRVAVGPKNDPHNDWGESEAAQAARERRLRARLRKWEKNPAALHHEFPTLSHPPENDDTSSKANIIFIGHDSPMALPSLLGSLGSDSHDATVDTEAQFFRSSVLVPRSRCIETERILRVARRREINELTIRMGVGAVGGIIEPSSASSKLADLSSEENSDKMSQSNTMWEQWGNNLELWSNVRKIADRALGSMMVSQRTQGNLDNINSFPTSLPWTAVLAAWKAHHALSDARSQWFKEVAGLATSVDEIPEGKGKLNTAGSATDKLVEAVKNDPDLDQYESRLLSCIVDSVAITTTFNQVHLPIHTIDSIRTIVSLPLLHPQAFQQGILKEHTMTGCLLFGPPGTGKTLAVRALAKEAGCRMLAVSPSDVMDMYVGEGEKLVKAVFSLARRLSPCVVFLDEIDALFGARMSARESGSAIAHRGVITEFMQEMDGLKSSKDDNVIVIGATNRPFDLDDAVLRRLPRRLLVDLPGEKERQEIINILLRDEALGTDVSPEYLARKTEGFSGSDLKHLCVSAALDSIKEHLVVPWSSRHKLSLSNASVLALSPQGLSSSDSPTPNSSKQQNEALQASTSDTSAAESLKEDSTDSHITPPEIVEVKRVLHLHNFAQALKEITPSSSETLGSLADLRKWNDEFGEGRKDRKKRQVWGKGRFGFIDSNKDTVDDGRVSK